MKKYVLITIGVNQPFDPEIWNQYMINAYYKYCLENFILPKIYQINKQNTQRQCLDLTGSIFAVNQAKQKYELMSEIERQRILIHNQILEPNEQLLPSSSHIGNNTLDSYNILLSCSSDDKVLSRHLSNRLIEEGYLVSTDYSNKTSSDILSKINKSDVVLICFSSNYSGNTNCMSILSMVKSFGKKCIPFLLTRSSLNHVDDWSKIIITEELYYESFREEIEFRLNEELDLDYDKLLIELLHYTKPGVVGRTYPMSDSIPNKEEHIEENLGELNVTSKFTPEEIREKEQTYEKYIQEILERDKIPEDELTHLIDSLKMVLEDCTKQGYSISTEKIQADVDELEEEEEKNLQNPKQKVHFSDYEETDLEKNDQGNTLYFSNYSNCFLSNIQQWIEKSSHGPVIKGNLPPFTLTSDFNDAIFQMPSMDKLPWWLESANEHDLSFSPSERHCSDAELIIGSWCNNDEAHHYYQILIDKDIQFREHKYEQHSFETEQEEANKDTSTNPMNSYHPTFNTNIKRGTIAWDLTENTEILAEYERRTAKKQLQTSKKNRSALERLIDRSVKLISDIKEGRIDMKSNEVQGRIGPELKTNEEINARNALDDPNNKIWSKKKIPEYRQAFIQMKISNTIQWQEFIAAQEKKTIINDKIKVN